MKSDIQRQKKKSGRKRVNSGWILTIFLCTVLISGILSLISGVLLGGANVYFAFGILLMIILIGILFDIIGVAVTAADPKPFHSMAAHRVRGAQEALAMLRSADRVSSFCNDVVGDVCGIVSGSASAAIVIIIAAGVPLLTGQNRVIEILMAALVSGITVGGKAIGKTLAMTKSTEIVHFAALVVYYVHAVPGRLLGRTKKK